MISIDKIKKLRRETGISLAECKKALDVSKGDVEKAKEILSEKEKDFAVKKQERQVSAGIIESYIHSNKKVGVLLDIRCETDFVAKNKEFQELAHLLCLQIAAMNPLFLDSESIPKDYLKQKEKEWKLELEKEKKQKDLMEKIIKGKIEKHKKEVCLLNQDFIKESEKTVQDLLNEYISKLGENIIIEKFTRYRV